MQKQQKDRDYDVDSEDGCHNRKRSAFPSPTDRERKHLKKGTDIITSDEWFYCKSRPILVESVAGVSMVGSK